MYAVGMTQELLLTAGRTISSRSYREPPVPLGGARATGLFSAISHGTELNLYRGSSPFADRSFDPALRLFLSGGETTGYPLKLGYEWVGVITELGNQTDPALMGRLVQLPLPHRETQTLEPAWLPPASSLMLLPEGFPPERALFLESAGIALQAVHDARLKVGDSVAVFGLGALGLMAVQLARLNGASHVVAIDPAESRRQLASELGADLVLDPREIDVALALRRELDSGGADKAIEFSGRYEALHEALRTVRPAGTVVAAGFYQGDAVGLRLGEEWHHNRLTLVSSMRGWGNTHRDYPAWNRDRLRATVMRLLAEGRLRTELFEIRRFGFEEAARAYRWLDENPLQTLKVILEYGT